ncbi:hypothetical protein G6F37_012444 [Rhizopus arrhizus]|nr:hypothetical protein G6F37_012444 [Rhizopus arrhizus]
MSKFDNLDKVLSEGSKGQKGMKITPEVDELLLKKIPPSACYRDLQTNIPTKNFAFPDFPFSEGTPAFTKTVSGVDIARSLEGFAKSITISIKGPFVSPNPIDNVLRQLIPKDAVIKSVIASFSNPDGKVDGSITFEDGSVMKEVDQSTKEGLPYADVPEGHVVLGPKSPLNVYRDTFLMSDPTFCFVSMPRFFSLSPYFDIQTRTTARVWSNNTHIPPREKMHQIEAEFKPDIPVDPFASDRVRKEMFVQ